MKKRGPRGHTALVRSGVSEMSRTGSGHRRRRRHHLFHRTVLHSMLGASMGGFLACAFSWLAQLDASSSKLFVALAAAGAFAGIAWERAENEWRKPSVAGLLGACGGLTAWLTAQWAPFSAALLGLAAVPVLAPDESPRRRLLTGVVAGGFGYAGLHVAEALLQSGAFLPLVPGAVAWAAAGATGGLFLGLASAPRHLIPTIDPLESAYAAALSTRDGEIHELLERALDIHRSIVASLDGSAGTVEPELRDRVTDQVLQILQIAEHCRQIDHQLDREALHRLEDRTAALARKASATLDPAARATYEQAISSLGEQRSALKQLGEGRERVVARLHVNVALLEKLRVSLLQIHSANAERFGFETNLVADTLEELGRELDATASAISEVFNRPSLTARISEESA